MPRIKYTDIFKLQLSLNVAAKTGWGTTGLPFLLWASVEIEGGRLRFRLQVCFLLTLENHNLSQLFEVYVHSVCRFNRTTSVDRFRLQTSPKSPRYNRMEHYRNPFCHKCIG